MIMTHNSIEQYYVPPWSSFNKDFLKKIMKDEKRLLKRKDVNEVVIPLFDELKVQDVWARYKQDERINIYLPDKLPKGRMPDRKWFFNVLNTVAPEVVKAMLEHALNARHMLSETKE